MAFLARPADNFQFVVMQMPSQFTFAADLCQIALLTAWILTQTAAAQTPPDESRFEKAVKAYEAADKAESPPQGAILLVGDSQFFRWKTLKEDLPGYTVINRGVDSFQFSDVLEFADRIVLP